MVWLMAHRKACTHVDKASSMMSSASSSSFGGLARMVVRRIAATVLCILSQIALAWGFLTEVGTLLIPACSSSS